MKKVIFLAVSTVALQVTAVLAGSVAYVAPVEMAITEDPGSMGGSGLWLIPLLAIALIWLVVKGQNDSEPVDLTSDARLKRNIKAVGTAENGLTLYEFQYLWSSNKYEGVMAQEVLKHTPEAVVRSKFGFYKVNYSKLGLEMKTIH